MAEIRYNNGFGFLGANLSSSTPGTSQTIPNLFAVAPDFATLGGSDYIKLCLDAGEGNFEIVYLTSYIAGGTTGTITRAAEDSTNWPAVAHSANASTWQCAPTILDFLEGPFSTASPTTGQQIIWNGSEYVPSGPYSAPGLYVPQGWGAKLALGIAAGNPRMICVGESIGQGFFASGVNFGNAYPGYIAQKLQAVHGDGGSGFVTAANIYGVNNALQLFVAYNNAENPGVATPALWYQTIGSDGFLQTVRNFTGAGTGNADAVLFYVRGTSIKIYYEAFGVNGGSVPWTLDSVSQTPLSTVSGVALNQLKTVTVSGLVPGLHAILIFPGAVCFGIAGVAGYNSTGFRVDNVGRSGMTTFEMCGLSQPYYQFTWSSAFPSVGAGVPIYYSPTVGVYTALKTGYYKSIGTTTVGHDPYDYPAEWSPMPMTDPWLATTSFANRAGGAQEPCDCLLIECSANDTQYQSFYGNTTTPPDALVENIRLYLDAVLESYGTANSGRASTPPDLIFVIPHIGGVENQVSTAGGARPFGDFALRIRALAEEMGAAVFDAWAAFRPSVNYLQGLGYWGTHDGTPGAAGATSADSPHLSDAGHAAYGNGILQILHAVGLY
jgi:hypothetical protein